MGLVSALSWLSWLVNKALASVINLHFSFRAKWCFVFYLLLTPFPNIPSPLSSVPEWKYVSNFKAYSPETEPLT